MITSPHLTPPEWDDYAAGRMTTRAAIAASDHLAECPACRQTLAGSRTAEVDWEEMRLETDEENLRHEELAVLTDGTLDDAQRAALLSRLASSPGASAELEDLRAFQAEMAALPPAAHVPAAESPPTPGKIIVFPERRWRWIPLAAAAAAILLAAGWWVERARPAPTGAAVLWTDAAGRTADLAALPADLRVSVLAGAQTGRLERAPIPAEIYPSAGSLADESTETRPTAGGLRQLSPVGALVSEDRPRLRWTPSRGATEYVIYLKDYRSGQPPVRDVVPAGRNEWTPPAPLVRGGVYEWQIEARRANEILDQAPLPPAPEARFQILDAGRAAELATVESRYAGFPLILGAAYARAGLAEAAADQFKELARQHPGSAPARQLQRSFAAAAPGPN